VHKLRDEYGQGGFLHFGQGKWYPGEQLPRWALSICWRADGQPIWHDPSLFADEREPHAYTAEDSQRFIQTLSRKLGLSDRFIEPGYEDTWYYLWRERRLPVNVDPFESKLDDEMERIRLRRVFTQGLDTVVGYVLPLQRNPAVGPAWPVRWDHRPVVLPRRAHVPDPGRFADGLPPAAGFAALGQQGRLPLPDRAGPLRQPRRPLPQRAARHCAPSTTPCRPARTKGGYAAHTTGGGFAEGGVVAVQGQGHGSGTGRPSAEQANWRGEIQPIARLFMPPLARLEDYLDLVAAVEATAASCA
jgi:uncharacterized protein (DUF2126 family)